MHFLWFSSWIYNLGVSSNGPSAFGSFFCWGCSDLGRFLWTRDAITLRKHKTLWIQPTPSEVFGEIRGKFAISLVLTSTPFTIESQFRAKSNGTNRYPNTGELSAAAWRAVWQNAAGIWMWIFQQIGNNCYPYRILINDKLNLSRFVRKLDSQNIYPLTQGGKKHISGNINLGTLLGGNREFEGCP